MKLSVKIFIGFALVIILSIVSFLINNKLSEEVNRNTIFLGTSESIIRNSVQIHKNIIEMQSAFRGYLLTDNTNFLEHYYDGLRELPPLFASQRDLIKGTGKQAAKFDSILLLHQQWIDYSNSLISAKQKKLSSKELKDEEEYSFLFNSKLQKEVGKKMNDEISRKFDEFDKYEYKVRHERRERLQESIENTCRLS